MQEQALEETVLVEELTGVKPGEAQCKSHAWQPRHSPGQGSAGCPWGKAECRHGQPFTGVVKHLSKRRVQGGMGAQETGETAGTRTPLTWRTA